MKVEIEVSEYDPKRGVIVPLEPDSVIATTITSGEIVIRANPAGLRELATHLLTLAQPAVPPGSHIHYDDLNFLEKASNATVIERI